MPAFKRYLATSHILLSKMYVDPEPYDGGIAARLTGASLGAPPLSAR